MKKVDEMNEEVADVAHFIAVLKNTTIEEVIDLVGGQIADIVIRIKDIKPYDSNIKKLK